MKAISFLECIIISLALIPIISNAAKLEGTLYIRQLCRSRPNGFQALVPGSCSKYYECQNGRTRVRTCPAFYDTAKGRCVSKNPGCVESKDLLPSCTGPCCGIVDGYDVNRDNQQIYYKCEDNKVVCTLTCADDKQFNLVKSECDIPGSCNSCTTPTTTTTAPCTPTSTTTTCSTTTFTTTTTTTCTTTTTSTTNCTPTTTTTTTTPATTSSPTEETTTMATTTTTYTSTTTTTTTMTTTTSTSTTATATTTTCTTNTTTMTSTTTATTTTCNTTTTTTTTNTTTTSTTTASTTTTTVSTSTTCSTTTTTTTTTTCTTTTSTITTTSCTATTTATCSSTTTKCATTQKAPYDASVLPAGIVKPPQTLQSNIDLYMRFACRNKPDSFMMASLKSCNEYYICKNGLALPISCGNMHFNVLKGICDFPQNSGCIQPQGYRNLP